MTQTTDTAETATRRLTRAEARQQTRERLLAAAAEVFKRQGYNGASLEAIAEAAGFTKGAVYSNFATKADLFIALLDRYVEAESQRQTADYDEGPVDAFIDDLDNILERQALAEGDWMVLQIEFWLAAVRDPAIAAKLVEGGRRIREEGGRTIDEQLAAADIHPQFTGEEISVLLNALASGLALDLQLDPTLAQPRLFSRAARALLGLPPKE